MADTKKEDTSSETSEETVDIVEELKDNWMLPMYMTCDGWVHETHSLWMIFKNDETEPFYNKFEKNEPGETHAEKKILADLGNEDIKKDKEKGKEEDEEEEDRYHCFIRSNYSPCHDCCNALRTQLPKLLGTENISVSIRVANFYKIHRPAGERNWNALRELEQRDDFKLEVFTNTNDWVELAEMYLKATEGGELTPDMEDALNDFHQRRLRRVEEDRRILECLQQDSRQKDYLNLFYGRETS